MSDNQIKELQQQIKQAQMSLMKLIAEKESKEKKEKDDKEIIFASATEDYSIQKMTELAESSESIEEATKYISMYFAPLEKTAEYLKWVPSSNEMIRIKNKEIGHHVGEYEKWAVAKRNRVLEFGAKQWLLKEYYVRFDLVTEINKPRVFIDSKTNKQTINLFDGFMHSTKRKYKDFPKSVRNKVTRIWDHIKNAWCSENEIQYEYVKRWICAMVNGKKMTTCIYLKGPEGLGKSIITDFLVENVIGERNCWVTQDAKCFLPGGFTGSLGGKLLLVLEELPCSSEGQWKTLSNALKLWITGFMVQLEAKQCNAIQQKNIASLFLLSNNNAIIISPLDRRYFIPDVSIKYLGNFQYFIELRKVMNEPEVGEAFYWFCKEFDNQNDDFDAQRDRPNTKARTDIILESLHTIYIYIKRRFLLYGRGIEKMKLTNFRDNYLSDLIFDQKEIKAGSVPLYRKHDLNVSPREINKKLNEIGIETKKGAGNYIYVNITFEDLKKIYEKKGWLDDFDIIRETNEEDSNSSIDECILNNNPKKNEEKNDEIKFLPDEEFNISFLSDDEEYESDVIVESSEEADEATSDEDEEEDVDTLMDLELESSFKNTTPSVVINSKNNNEEKSDSEESSEESSEEIDIKKSCKLTMDKFEEGFFPIKSKSMK